MADLRESGQIEQDATTIIMLHNPNGEEESDGEVTEREIIIAKCRDGRRGVINAMFSGPDMTLMERADDEASRFDGDFSDGLPDTNPEHWND
jgi:replicative DNA helicase